MDSNAPRVHRQQALAAYVEPLAVGRRVVVLGDASLSLGPRISELGARSVHLWDPNAERAHRAAELAPHGVIACPLPQRGQPFDDPDEQRGAFDLAVIPDLEIFDDAADLLARVRNLVGEEGAVLVCAPNRDGDNHSAAFDYYELFDLVAGQFDDVTMIAQLPFHGVALAELVEGEGESPAVTVDTQLAGSNRTPEAFVALGSQRGVRLDPYAIVELPQRLSEAEEVEASEAVRMALAQAGVRAAGLEEQLEELRAHLGDMERGERAARGLEEALRNRSSQVADLESALAGRLRDVVALSQEVERMRATADAERAVAAQLDELVFRTERAERALAALEPEQVRATEVHAAELARYEEGLRDRAKAMRALEAELVRRERMVRELVDAIDEAGSHPTSVEAPPNPDSGLATDVAQEHIALTEANAQLRRKLDALALDLARREGEAQASAWTIAELERHLESAARRPTPPDDTPAIEPNPDTEAKRHLASALDELDVLRRALTQEHEARMVAESGRLALDKPAQD
jgi:hypothetical protein